MKKILLVVALTSVLSARSQTRLSYDNDVAEHVQSAYRLFFEKQGVTVYSGWVTYNGKAEAVSIKVTNNNNFPVIVTWAGPKWYANGVYLDPLNNPGGNIPDQLGYSDKYSPSETKDGIYHKRGTNGAEVYKFRPNWLYFQAPQGWRSTQLRIQLADFQVLDARGNPLR